MALTKVTYSMIKGAPANLQDYGGDPTGVVDSSPAFTAAFAKSNIIYVPAGTYKMTSTVTVPPYGQVIGAGINNTIFNVTASVVGFVTQYWSVLSNFKIKANPGHGVNLIEVGSATLDGGRGMLTDLWVEAAGADGIQLIQGNLGLMQNIVSINNALNGVRFLAGSPDLNAWTVQGYVDVRGNGNDGFRIEGGTSASDNNCSKSNFISGLVAQQNTQYGVFIGTRSNLVSCYSELNTANNVVLGNYAYGNEIKTVEGYVVDTSSGRVGSNIVYNYNADADYKRIFQNKTLFSGQNDKGWRINNENSTIGWLDCFKQADRSYVFKTGGSGANQAITFTHEDYPAAYVNTTFNGTVTSVLGFTNKTVTWTAGTGTPEGAVIAPVGSLFSRTDGGASTTLYVKQSGTGNTGWVAK